MVNYYSIIQFAFCLCSVVYGGKNTIHIELMSITGRMVPTGGIGMKDEMYTIFIDIDVLYPGIDYSCKHIYRISYY